MELDDDNDSGGILRRAGSGPLAASAAALFALAAGAAWMAWRLVAVGAPGGSWFLFLLECDLPPLGFPAALLPVGACLALGRRGRAVAYVASALMAAAGLVVCARLAMRIPISELMMVDDSFRVTFSLAQSARAVAIYAAERLSAMAFGLGAALWMESRINETPARGEHLIDRRI